MSEMSIAELILQSPYRNVYWYARYLVNTDKYGAIGTRKENLLLETVTLIETILIQPNLSDTEKLTVAKEKLKQDLLAMFQKDSKNYHGAYQLSEELETTISSISDVVVFCFTVKYVVIPINQALKQIPSDDRMFAEKQAKAILDALKEKGVSKVIQLWDSLGERGCL